MSLSGIIHHSHSLTRLEIYHHIYLIYNLFKTFIGDSFFVLSTMESPVAQWLEHPTRSRRVVGSNPIWSSEFFSEFPIDVKKKINK